MSQGTNLSTENGMENYLVVTFQIIEANVNSQPRLGVLPVFMVIVVAERVTRFVRDYCLSIVINSATPMVLMLLKHVDGKPGRHICKTGCKTYNTSRMLLLDNVDSGCLSSRMVQINLVIFLRHT